MPNTKSAKKRVRVEKKKTLRNKMINSSVKTACKKAVLATEEGSKEEALKVIHIAESELDKAAVKGIIHKNKVARKKSRLMKKANKMS